jgi:uncharacterized protein YbjT (DUF2867 family)
MNSDKPILVTGAAGNIGAVGNTITSLLLERGFAVRAMVHRDDDRAQSLRDKGAEVVIGDLLDLNDMHRIIEGCGTLYFGMSVSDHYLEASINVAAVALHHRVEAFINMSQMTLSQMSITETTDSPQHKLHWLAEQALNWSGLPVVHVRPTVFMDVLGRPITYTDVPVAAWREAVKGAGLPDHVINHLSTMGDLHRAGRYARMTDDFVKLTGKEPITAKTFIERHATSFAK